MGSGPLHPLPSGEISIGTDSFRGHSDIAAGPLRAGLGGVFIVLALLWGWKVDAIVPDRFDLVGSALALIGLSVIMMYGPRGRS